MISLISFDIVRYRTDENDTEININELPDCKADEDMIRQVFTNLVDNAINYLLSPESDFLTGETIRVNGGLIMK